MMSRVTILIFLVLFLMPGCEEPSPQTPTMPALVTPIAVESMPQAFFFGTEKQRALQDELVGQPMPPLWVEDWRNGEPTLEDLQGKIVLVDFWATWCVPCFESLPKRHALLAKYGDQGVMIVGVCGSKRGQDKYDQVLNQHPMDYPTARDPSGAFGEWWRVMWMPTYALVDRKGVIRAVGLHPEKLEEAVLWLLEEQPAPETSLP
ncbi:TlpA family protein disulfide reductase [Algisphaera agarilytica]|uniref:Thiol-disulfide isomerase/thioredoxin n=1 Tax=Algisphaera agarilytica TaxID=1385975 RepID=A0A7X0H4Y7_9BACT|nr:TlpA disulfide reductase family protein [Algisphaera agarilytica]MBB6428226.1 thiol-disulfide isomerase/thioredoxin [Algisphaera agarilytica]